jgi:hypothetical protein
MSVQDQNAKRPMTLHLHREEDMSILVSTDGVAAHAVFLPRSKIEIAPERQGARVMVSVPEWLVKEKGLLAQAGAGQGSLF